MLFLFSDVGEKDAPTRLLPGSHLDIPPLLAPYGEKGLSFLELSERLEKTLRQKVVLATGEAGTVYLCHPFLVHFAQRHEGNSPRFMAQPPLLPSGTFRTKHEENDYSPVRLAINGDWISVPDNERYFSEREIPSSSPRNSARPLRRPIAE
jgi:hypothetical protein